MGSLSLFAFPFLLAWGVVCFFVYMDLALCFCRVTA